MRLKRALAVAVFATAAIGGVPAATASHDCETNPNHCYECVRYPCYPEDYVPFLLDTARDVVSGGGGS